MPSAATDAELDRVLWLLGATGIARDSYTFTSSRIDLRSDGVETADVGVSWDLATPIKTIFSSLIRAMGVPGTVVSPVELQWSIVSAATCGTSSRVWDVSDL